jgi:hypothetical protein
LAGIRSPADAQDTAAETDTVTNKNRRNGHHTAPRQAAWFTFFSPPPKNQVVSAVMT